MHEGNSSTLPVVTKASDGFGLAPVSSLSRQGDIFNHTTDTIIVEDRHGVKYPIPPTMSKDYAGKILIVERTEWSSTVDECSIGINNKPLDMLNSEDTAMSDALELLKNNQDHRKNVRIEHVICSIDLQNFGGCFYVKPLDINISLNGFENTTKHPRKNDRCEVAKLTVNSKPTEGLFAVLTKGSAGKMYFSVNGMIMPLVNRPELSLTNGIYHLDKVGRFDLIYTFKSNYTSYSKSKDELVEMMKSGTGDGVRLPPLDYRKLDTHKLALTHAIEKFDVDQDHRSKESKIKLDDLQAKSDVLQRDLLATEQINNIKQLAAATGSASTILKSIVDFVNKL